MENFETSAYQSNDVEYIEEIKDINNRLYALYNQLAENKSNLDNLAEVVDYKNPDSIKNYQLAREEYYHKQDSVVTEIDKLEYRKALLEWKSQGF